jgi:hypothetical protein
MHFVLRFICLLVINVLASLWVWLPVARAEWANATKEDFLNYIAPSPSVNIFKPSLFLAEDDPITLYVQEWANHLHQRLQLQGVPLPKIIVTKIPRLFSNTTYLPVCYSVPVVFGAAAAKIDKPVYLNYDGELRTYDHPCKPTTDLKGLVSHLKKVYPKCSINLTDVVNIKNCPVNSSLSAYGRASSLVVSIMSPWIIMDIGKFNLLKDSYTEDMFLNELTHELAHFYSAHLSLSHQITGRFYIYRDYNWSQWPPPKDPLLQVEGEKIKSAFVKSDEQWNQRASLTHLPAVHMAIVKGIAPFSLEDDALILGLKYAALIGVNPRAMIDGMFLIWQAQAHRQSPRPWSLETGFQQCHIWYQNQWADGNKAILAPVGDFASYHHTFCFEIYEMDQILKAQKITEQIQVRPAVSISWQLLKKRAPQVIGIN